MKIEIEKITKKDAIKFARNGLQKSSSLMREKGISLLSLIVTVIIMLILSGVVINLTMGGEGLFENAKKAEEKHKISDYTEKIELARGEVRNK